jgi:ribosomal protein uL24
MKTHQTVSSSRRKSRKACFAAPSHLKRKLMSAHLSKDLRAKYHVRSAPIRKDDEVVVMSGKHKNEKAKVTQVYRKKWCVYLEKKTREKQSGQSVNIPFHPSRLQITTLKMDKDRTNALNRRNNDTKDKGKVKVKDAEKRLD